MAVKRQRIPTAGRTARSVTPKNKTPIIRDDFFVAFGREGAWNEFISGKAHNTEEEAIEEAKGELSGRTGQKYYVAQVILMVETTEPPVKITNFRPGAE